MARFVGLLRGINVGGHNKVPMAKLRDLCAGLGWSAVETYIQSGNLVFEAEGKAADLEAQLEKAIDAAIGVTTPVIIRPAGEWTRLIQTDPFRKESAEAPERVLVGLPKAALKPGAAEAIEARAAAGERVVEAAGALWFHYPEGVGRSKITPAMIDRAAGSPVTARNWRTMLKLQEMLA